MNGPCRHVRVPRTFTIYHARAYPGGVKLIQVLALVSCLGFLRALALVTIAPAVPSWTAFGKTGTATAYVDIRLKPGTLPINASFAVETVPAVGAFRISASRLTLSRAGTARLVVVSSGAPRVEVRLREITSGGQQLSAELNFHGPLAMAPSVNSVSNTTPFQLGISGGVPPYTITTIPSGILAISPDGTAAALGTRPGSVVLTVTDAKRKTARAEVMVRLPFKPSLNGADWLIRSTVAILRPTNLTHSPGWFLDFPVLGSGRSVGYVTQARPFSYLEGSALEARFSIATEGPVVFDHYTEAINTSDFPAHVRFLLQNGPISWDMNGRWWSNPIAVKLEPGSFTLRVPLDPSQWSNVSGQKGDFDASTRAGFARVLANTSELGFTFGGGFFFGHGVRVSGGKARFILTGFDVIP
jgi:hypothetical protein